MEKNLLLRILTGESTLEEKDEFYTQLGTNKEEENLFYEIKSLWIKSSMNHTKMDIDSEFETLWSKIKQPVKQRSLLIGNRMLQYAAILLITLTIGGAAGYFVSNSILNKPDSGLQTFTAMKGSVSIIEFGDGTKVWLNSGSKLTYHEDFKNKQRLAELKGEAYFEVTHHENFPLLVKAGQIVIRDLGTTFNIKAYPGDQLIETSLVEGKAEILSANGKSMIALNPGESAIYSKSENRIKINPLAQNVVSAWRDGKFVIRDQRLEDIFKEISRWYNVEFRFENQKYRDFRYTGNIKKSTTAQYVLKMLKVTTNFDYKIIEKPTEPDLIIIY